MKQPTLMPTGTPYQVLAANGLDWYQKNGGQGKKVCAMAQDDAYGASGLDGLTQAAKTLKRQGRPKTVRFATGSDISAQVGELADANCDAVVLVSLPQRHDVHRHEDGRAELHAPDPRGRARRG